MNRKQLEACRQRLYRRFPLLGGWLRRQAVNELVLDASLEAVRILAEAVTRSDDEQVRSLALEFLAGLTNPRHAEAVGELWLQTRHPALTRLLAECPWLPQAPLRVRVLHALTLGRDGALAAEGAKAVEPLLKACADHDAGVARRAREALARLEAPEARDALCRVAMQPGQDLARDLAVAAGVTPRDRQRQALFFFLTGQWERYDALDLDRTLLRAACLAGDDGLRRRLAEKARQAGRLEWVEAITDGRRKLRLAALADPEWRAVLDVLASGGRWDDLWRLVREAPADWSARILRRLRNAGWPPPERAEFDGLLRLAEGWDAAALAALTRPAAALTGHTEPVAALTVTPDSKLLLSAGPDRTVRFWGLPEGKAIRPLHTDGGPVTSLAVSADGRLLASGSADRTVRLWGLPGGDLRHTLKGGETRMGCVALAADGALAAGGDDLGKLWLWGAADGRPLRRWTAHSGHVTALAFDPSGRFLASASLDGSVRLWGLPDGGQLKMLQHGEWVHSLALAADGRLLASAGYDRRVQLWSVPEGTAAASLEGHTDSIQCAAMGADGRVLASGGHDKTVRLWALPEGDPLHTLHEPAGAAACLALSPDGRVLAGCAGDRKVRLWTTMALRLSRFPVGALSLHDLRWAEEALAADDTPDAARRALKFVAALLRRRWEAAPVIDDAPRPIEVGEFDIEVVG
jgi:WD40 repeat protein